MIEVRGKYGKAVVYTPRIDNETYRVLLQYLNTFISERQKIRIMPDTHAGKGVVIGFTAKLNDFIVPNIVGVDIGCGVCSLRLGKDIPSLKEVDEVIKEKIPAGISVHQETKHLKGISKEFLKKVRQIAEKTQQDADYVLASLGTLGGGNHFIEIGVDSNGEYWLTIHTGSRNFGLKVARHHQKIAEWLSRKTLINTEIEELKRKYSGKELGKRIEEVKEKYSFPKELSFLTGKKAEDYLNDMRVAQEYAQLNRRLIASLILDALGIAPKEIIESVHNYIDFEDKIIRKGAIRAHKGEKVVIPMHMAYGVVVGIGKGNPEWNFSAPHGAGRKMSRKEAKEKISLNEFIEELKKAGVYSTTACESTKDEAPQAYKNPDEVIALLRETIDVVDIIRPVYNFKG